MKGTVVRLTTMVAFTHLCESIGAWLRHGVVSRQGITKKHFSCQISFFIKTFAGKACASHFCNFNALQDPCHEVKTFLQKFQKKISFGTEIKAQKVG